MLDPTLETQLKGHLARLAHPIELRASLDASASSDALRTLLADLGALSASISVRLDGQDDRRPSFSIGRPGQEARVRFAGVPMGHEFTSLVLALLQIGGHPPRIDAATRARIEALEGPLACEVFVSLSCHNCPDVVQALNVLAVLNPRITSTMVDGAVFPDEVAARGLMAVPAVFVNGAPLGQGRMSIEEILQKVDVGRAARAASARADRLQELEPFDVLVVGGGPAGAAAAIYAARKGIRTGVVADRFGGQVLDTMGIENLIAAPATEGPRLARALEAHVADHDVELILQERGAVLSLPDADGLSRVRLEGGATLSARTVILATGARWRELNVPGERAYRGRGVAYCPHCDGPLFEGKRVAVVGGGNSGVEAAIDLAGLVRHVTLLEFEPALRADAVLVARLRSLPNVEIVTHAQTLEVVGDGAKVTGLRHRDRASRVERELALDGVFVQIGLSPNTDWLAGTLALSPRGEIEVDARGQTSVPGVFAAGDVTTVPYKQIVIAMGDGAKAALSAFDHLIRTGPVPAVAA